MNNLKAWEQDFGIQEPVVDIDMLHPLIVTLMNEYSEMQHKIALVPLLMISEENRTLLDPSSTPSRIERLHLVLIERLSEVQERLFQAKSIFDAKTQDAKNLENLLLDHAGYKAKTYSTLIQKRIEREYAVTSLKTKYFEFLRQAADIIGLEEDTIKFETIKNINSTDIYKIVDAFIVCLNERKSYSSSLLIK